jgi:hypothetical protein
VEDEDVNDEEDLSSCFVNDPKKEQLREILKNLRFGKHGKGIDV